MSRRSYKRPHKRLYKRKRSIGCAIITLIYAIAAFWGVFHLFSSNQQPHAFVDNSPRYEIASGLYINSSNAILVNLDDKKTLFAKDSGEKIYPASMTKIMTAVVALENLNNLNESVLLRKEMYAGIYKANAVTAGFLPNEEVRIIDLLYGLLLPSGAECAIGLAQQAAGSESAFADLMNAKAQELGMDDTYFVNATGLHDAKHYSTVKDIAVLLEYALENDTFYKIFTTVRYASRPTNLHPNGITFYSTLFSNMISADFDGGSILGGKTGYTDKAYQCLASLAEKNGKHYILVTCGAEGDRKTQNLHIDDAFTVYAAIP